MRPSKIKAALRMLNLTQAMRARRRDAQCLESAVFWLRTTNANRQCIEVVERYQKVAARQGGWTG